MTVGGRFQNSRPFLHSSGWGLGVTGGVPLGGTNAPGCQPLNSSRHEEGKGPTGGKIGERSRGDGWSTLTTVGGSCGNQREGRRTSVDPFSRALPAPAVYLSRVGLAISEALYVIAASFVDRRAKKEVEHRQVSRQSLGRSCEAFRSYLYSFLFFSFFPSSFPGQALPRKNLGELQLHSVKNR
ncbi:hypothetical protein VTK73DRAFT_7109 [Phialemonium thermophilum]|uniref:Uncharacterized protein n=1 Tax=Phialemonium thermophilum TaxID=223376 RepID=A0ABR3WGB9_9PEZI